MREAFLTCSWVDHCWSFLKATKQLPVDGIDEVFTDCDGASFLSQVLTFGGHSKLVNCLLFRHPICLLKLDSIQYSLVLKNKNNLKNIYKKCKIVSLTGDGEEKENVRLYFLVPAFSTIFHSLLLDIIQIIP